MAVFRSIGVAIMRFSSRAASAAIHCKKAVPWRRVWRGDMVVLFAEGTSSDGMRVLPFKPSFLSVLEDNRAFSVQAMSLLYKAA